MYEHSSSNLSRVHEKKSIFDCRCRILKIDIALQGNYEKIAQNL